MLDIHLCRLQVLHDVVKHLSLGYDQYLQFLSELKELVDRLLQQEDLLKFVLNLLHRRFQLWMSWAEHIGHG